MSWRMNILIILFDLYTGNRDTLSFTWMSEEIFFIFVKVVEPPSLLSSVFGALSMFGVVEEVVVLVKLYADETL